MEENKVLDICTKVPAALSLLCSGYIAYSILSNHQKRSSETQRIILGISCVDIVVSFFFFLSTWPIPSGTENVPGAVGNTQTCELQGFFIHLGIMAPMYNGLLALYCYLYVCREWERRQMKSVELYGHIVVFVFGLSTAIAGLPLDLYNAGKNFCWIWQSPFDCTQSFQSEDGTTDCTRGDNAAIYQLALYGTILWVNIFWTLWSMLRVYVKTRKQEKKMEAYISEYSVTSSRRVGISDSRDVAVRGALFSGAFLITYLPATIARLVGVLGTVTFPLRIVAVTFAPSQGIFNFFVYILHPAVSCYLKERDKKRQGSTQLEQATTE